MNENRTDTVDAIEMKRRIQEQIYEDTKGMTSEEFIAYMRQRIANSPFANILKRTQLAASIDDSAFVRGDQGVAEERLPLE